MSVMNILKRLHKAVYYTSLYQEMYADFKYEIFIDRLLFNISNTFLKYHFCKMIEMVMCKLCCTLSKIFEKEKLKYYRFKLC